MKQHNYWKLRQIQGKYIQIALWLLAIIFLILQAVQFSIDFSHVSTVVGIVCPVLSIVLMVFEHWLWKNRIVQFLMKRIPFLDRYWTPILEGRWKGYFTRGKETRIFYIEIKQSYSSISCTTYSQYSESKAIFSEILFDENNNHYQLAYYWRANTTNAQPGTGDNNTFCGFTVLDIINEDEIITKLKGKYFTDRQPNQTHGTLDFEYQQKKLIGRFE